MLHFQAGWAGRDYWREAIVLNQGKGNMGMNHNKTGFKPLLVNSKDIKPGKKSHSTNGLGKSGFGFYLGYSKD